MHLATGIYKEFGGQAGSADQAGIAIESLVQRSAQVLGGVNRNYKRGRKHGTELLLNYLERDLITKDQETRVDIEKTALKPGRTVMLNGWSEDGARTNRVVLLKKKLALGETPASVSYRQQQAAAFAEVLKALPPEIQPAMIDIYLSMLDIPMRDEVLERIGGITGYRPEAADPRERAEQQRQADHEAAMQRKAEMVEMMEREAVAEQALARARLDNAKAAKLESVDSDFTAAKTAEVMAEIDSEYRSQDRLDVEESRDLVDTGSKLMIAAREAFEKSKAETGRDNAGQRQGS